MFGPLYDTFSGEGKICKRTFLEILYSFLVDKKSDHTHNHALLFIVTINRISSVRTIVAKDLIGESIIIIIYLFVCLFFLEFYKEEGTRKELEQCILNIEATSFDIHHVSLT